MHARRHWNRPRVASGFVAALAMLAPLGIAVPLAAPASAVDGAVSVWVTEADESSGPRLQKQTDQTWGSNSGGVNITVDASQTYQSIVGFGASFTDTSSEVVNHLGESKKTEWFNDLFTRSTTNSAGIGLSWLRQPLGASDYISLNGRSIVAATGSYFYTYQDNPADGVNVDADSRSIAHVVRAKQLNPNLVVVGTPWSAPGWMRQNNSILGNVGGPLKSDQEQAYATYLAEVAQQYQDRGAGLDYVTIQNEPDFEPSYPGMKMDAWQQARVANALAPKLAGKGLPTKILGWDHNWDQPAYPTTVLQQAGNSVAGTAWHCYAVNQPGVDGYDDSRPIISAGKQSEVHSSFPAKDTFLTECSSTESGDRSRTFQDSMWYHMSVVTIPALRNWSRSLSYWNLALDQNNGPYPGGYNICPTCTAVTTVDSQTNYTRGAPYYFLGHFSKFIQQGAVRIGSSEADSSVQNVAFKNPDGTYAVVVHNGGGGQDVTLSFEGKSIKRHFPSNTVVTFTWGTPAPVEPADPIVSESDGPVGAVIALGSAKCLDLKSGSETKANGTPIQQYDCNGTPKGQRWQYRKASDKTLRIRGKCLTTASDSAGAKATLYDCSAARTKAWTVAGDRLTSPSGLCLAVPGNSGANATELELASCSGASGQRWLVPSTTVTGNATIASAKASSRCLGTSSSVALGTPVNSVPCAGASAVLRGADDSIRLGGKCVAYRSAEATNAASDGAKLILAYCTGQNEQKWDTSVSNQIKLTSANQCLDLTDGNTTSVVQLQVWTCDSANSNQRWSVTSIPDGGTEPGGTDPDPGDGGGDPDPGDGGGDPDPGDGGGDPDPGDGNGDGTGGETPTSPQPVRAQPQRATSASELIWQAGSTRITATGVALKVGKPGVARVFVTQNSAAAAGRITLTYAGRTATTPVVAGIAEFDLPRATKAGTQTIDLTYQPASGTALTATGRVTVGKGAAKNSSIKITKGKRGKGIRIRTTARFKVRVKAPAGVPATGRVTLKVGKRTLAKAPVQLKGKKWVATINVKAKANKKAGRIKVVYSGNADLGKAVTKTALRVRR